MNSASKEYKNISANKGAQLVQAGIPKTTQIFSMRKPNISVMPTAEYFCVGSESWITKFVQEWLTAKYEYFPSPFLLKKQLSMIPKSIVFDLS
jgi:hypothetical protein